MNLSVPRLIVGLMLLPGVALASNIVFGQSLVSQLPKDGTWAKYKMTGERKRRELTREGHEFKKDPMNGEMTIRCVGSISENMELLRWIEIEIVMEGQLGTKITQIDKVLIHEENIGGDKHFLNDVKKWWHFPTIDPDLRVAEIKPGASRVGIFEFFFPHKFENRAELEFRTYSSGLGIFRCDGVSGSCQVKLPNSDMITDHKINVFSNKISPFGSVYYEVESISKDSKGESSKLQLSFTLEETGTGAKSGLPDNN